MANWGTTSVFGDPSQPGWAQENLVTVTASNGQTWQVNKLAAPAFQAFLHDLEAAGYDPQSSGGYNYRPIRGSSRLSQHAFGNAIDINAQSNALGSSQTDMPANVSALAAKYGLEWGGNWKNRPDPMHFEWTGNGMTAGPAGMPQNTMPQNGTPQNTWPQSAPQNAFASYQAQPTQNALVLQPNLLDANAFRSRRFTVGGV